MTSGITRSVWSFWTKPFRAHRQSIWFSEKHHLLAWVLSLETARKHYPETSLVTDDEGAQMLVDGIGLEFDSVSTELNQLRQQDPDWWILGKLWAYRSQTQPFIHVDADVFLWNALPDRVNTAPVLVQNPEDFVFGEHDATCWWYRPEVFDERVKRTGGWLPEEWEWYIARQRNLAYCCGIVGGNHVDFLTHYADRALKMATNSRNQDAFELMDNKPGDCLLIEQYFLAACIEYHQHAEDPAFGDVSVECLFDSTSAAFSSDQATKLGYTHLIGAAKRDAAIAKRLEKRVAQEYPAQYARCLQYLEKQEFYLGSQYLDAQGLALVTEPTAPEPDIQSASASVPAIADDRLNQVINASWHHDQILTQQELTNLMDQVGLVVQFAKPVRVDSLHSHSVLLWNHSSNEMTSPCPARLEIQPVRVTHITPQPIRWRMGSRDTDAEFELITAAEPLDNALFTEAVRLKVPITHDITDMTVVLRGDWIMDETFLFDLDLAFAPYLEQRHLTPELQHQFELHGILLSNRVAIAPELPRQRWRCCDQTTGHLYIIQRQAVHLSVYQSRALDGNHLYPGVPERPSGNGSEGGDWLSVLHVIPN